MHNISEKDEKVYVLPVTKGSTMVKYQFLDKKTEALKTQIFQVKKKSEGQFLIVTTNVDIEFRNLLQLKNQKSGCKKYVWLFFHFDFEGFMSF